jgi:predicted RecA/RadA family phage recombinase
MKLTAVPTLLLLCAAAVACDSSRQIAPEDARVEDSVLAHDLLAAEGVEFNSVVEEPVREDSASLAARAKASPPKRQLPRPQRTVATEVRRPVTLAASAVKPKPATKVPVAKTVERDVTPARAGTVARGSQLSLVVGRHVCDDDLQVGQTFAVNVVSAVRGSNGVAIPEGAQAVAKITSTNAWGSGIGVRVRSIRINGRNYPIESPVAYVLPEKRKGEGVCIPERTRIDVVTGQNLTLG